MLENGENDLFWVIKWGVEQISVDKQAIIKNSTNGTKMRKLWEIKA